MRSLWVFKINSIVFQLALVNISSFQPKHLQAVSLAQFTLPPSILCDD